jgi:hypothetical protein
VIDFGLLVSMIVAVGVPALAARRWSLQTYPPGSSVIDIGVGPAMAGLVVGRIVAVGLDDPSSLGRLPDLLIIRSGVEFWPGVAAAVAVLAWSARRDEIGVMGRLADVAPLALLGYASYEAACPVRDGCFGPASPVGLTPPGLTTTMVPVGILMGAVVAVGAILLRRAVTDPAVATVGAVFVVAAVRAAGSFWLPHVGQGLTRQHLTSIVIAAVTVVSLGGLLRLGRRQRGAGLSGA